MTTHRALPTTEVSDELVQSIPNLRHSLKVCAATSGLPLKVIAAELQVDRSQLSRMFNPSDEPRHFPPELIHPLQILCGNEIPLHFQLLQHGLPSPRVIRAMQAELAELRREVAELRGDRKAVFNIFKGLNEEAS